MDSAKTGGFAPTLEYHVWGVVCVIRGLIRRIHATVGEAHQWARQASCLTRAVSLRGGSCLGTCMAIQLDRVPATELTKATEWTGTFVYGYSKWTIDLIRYMVAFKP